MKYAVVGTGYWGENHVRVATELRDEGHVDEVVVCDVDEQRAADAAGTFDLDYVTDTSDLADLGVDAATVATPSPTHESVATDLLEDGVDLLVEKPLALDGETAWNIVDAADRHDRTLGVGHIFRFHPALRELKRRVERGDLGDLRYLTSNRFAFRTPRKTAGALHSLAVHDVDIYRYLLGEDPDTVTARCDSFVRDDVDETATLLLGYGDVTGHVSVSWHVPVFGKERHLVAVGSERTAYIDYLEDTKLEVYDSRFFEEGGTLRRRDEGKQVHEAPQREPLKAEVEEFVAASEGRATFSAPGEVGARAVDLLDAATASDEQGREVEL
ncbi:Gfo/Idh/MocA family protein [Halospeciosus flavus]|uniref:Gfo/Idh/MocA family protein n=1 Tax=Halospeciosus flavus TaxID=3032283 RepID=A0ABD5Z107_9EURY|nr:Gfo/Idh/MocA family oxidoreductase [Halospeciosus flavus]